MTPEAALTLNTLGRRCPAPIIELARHLRDVQPGEVIAVLSDDAAAALDVPAWCELRAQEYLGSEGFAYFVRRVQDPSAGAGSGGGGGGGGGGN